MNGPKTGPRLQNHVLQTSDLKGGSFPKILLCQVTDLPQCKECLVEKHGPGEGASSPAIVQRRPREIQVACCRLSSKEHLTPARMYGAGLRESLPVDPDLTYKFLRIQVGQSKQKYSAARDQTQRVQE